MSRLPTLDERTMTVAFDRALGADPDRVAQLSADGQWTFAESHARSLRLVGGLHTLGARFAQPVGLMLDNTMDAVHLWQGLALTGAVEVPVNTAFKARFLSHVLADSGVELLVLEAGYCDRLAAVADDVPSLRTVVVRGDDGGVLPRARFRVVPFAELEQGAIASPRRVSPADLMALMYTSGTTGPAKGVMVPHAHAYTYASRQDDALPSAEDSVLVTLPLFHLAGQWYGVYQSLIHQARCVLEPAFSPSRFWEVVRRNGITVTTLLGAMAELLQQQPARVDDADNPLRLAIMAPLASDIEGFRRRFAIDLAAVYGTSECGAVLSGPPNTIVGGEAGFPRGDFELRVVDREGEDVPSGEVGELLVRPRLPHTVMAGYHNLPEKSAETLRDGWVHTGDAFRTDSEGRFYFRDRIKDALRRRGENVSSFEVESVVNEHSSVYESAVVAVPAELTEDEIKVVVVAREGHTIDEHALTKFLIERLPYFMVPRYVEIADELPKTPTQKVRKHLLRDSGAGGQVWDREAAGIVLRRGN